MINLIHTVPSDRWGLLGSRLVYSAVSCSGTPKMGWWYCFTWKLNAVPSWPCFLPQQSADPSFSTSSWWMELLDKFQRMPKEPRVTPHGQGFAIAEVVCPSLYQLVQLWEVTKAPSQISHWQGILDVEMKLHFSIRSWLIKSLSSSLSPEAERSARMLLVSEDMGSICTPTPENWWETCSAGHLACAPFHVHYALDTQHKGGGHPSIISLCCWWRGGMGALSSKEHIQTSLLWWVDL